MLGIRESSAVCRTIIRTLHIRRVVTTVHLSLVQLEGSIFTAANRTEARYNFEAHPWNSRSARLSFAPNRNWSMQVSHGLLRNPEALEPGDVRRTTASISYNRPLKRGNWATSLIWGRNHENHGGEIFNLNGYVAESRELPGQELHLCEFGVRRQEPLLKDADRAILGITTHHRSNGAYTFGRARVWTSARSRWVWCEVSSLKPAISAIYGQHTNVSFVSALSRANEMSNHGPGGCPIKVQ